MGTPIAAFPSRIATAADLKVANNGVQTTLTTPIGTTDLTLKVSSGAGFAANQLVSIDNEIVSITGIAGTTITVGQRGFDGTAAAAHVIGAPVRLLVDAWHHNSVSTEVMAIENFLGAGGSNLGTVKTAAGYNFTPQTPGGSLTVGNNSITLSPVPTGINGSNTKHYLYISGGTGTAEAVLITGGSATSGAASGTLIINCANTHSGAWTISSATQGIQEAEKSLPAQGGIVYLGSGSIQLQAPVSFQPNRTFQGYGAATKLIPASSSAVVFDWNLPVHSTSLNMARDNILFIDFVIDGSVNVTNTVTGVRTQVQGSEIVSVNGMRFERVYFNNVRYAVSIQAGYDVSFSGVRAFGNTQFLINVPASAPNAKNAFLIDFSNLEYFWYFMGGSSSNQVVLTNEAVIRVEQGELVYITDSFFECSGGTTNNMDGISYLGGEDLSISNTVMNNPRYGVALGSSTLGGTAYAGYVKIVNLSLDQLWTAGIWIADGTDAVANNVHNVLIANSIISNPHPLATTCYPLSVGQYARYVNVSHNQFVNYSSAYPNEAIAVQPNAAFVVLDSNIISEEVSGSTGGTGIFIDANAAVYGVESTVFYNMQTPVNDGGYAASTIPSAATITLPGGRSAVYITGSTNISTITVTGVQDRFTVLLVFTTGGLTVNNGTLKLSGNLVATAWSTLTLKLMNGAWVETARSVK